LPASHTSQYAFDSCARAPSPQRAHSKEPNGEIVPAGHGTQLKFADAPAPARLVDAFAHFVPGAHTVHSAEPSRETWPRAQTVHRVEFGGEKWFCGQYEHRAALTPSGTVPAGHGRHARFAMNSPG